MIQAERQYEKLPRQLSPEEMRQAGVDLAHESMALETVEAARKVENARMRVEAQMIRDRISELVRVIDSGVREVETEIMSMMDTPVRGTKRIIRLDTNEAVRDEPMSDRERQDAFGFAE